MFSERGVPAGKPNFVCPAGRRSRPVPGRSSSIWGRRHRRPLRGLPAPFGGLPLPHPEVRDGAAWPCTPWGLPGRPRHRGRRCALTAPFHPLPVPRTLSGPSAGLLSVARAVAAGIGDAFPLGSTVPCGVRTFLTASNERPRRSDDPADTLFRGRASGEWGRGSPAAKTSNPITLFPTFPSLFPILILPYYQRPLRRGPYPR